MQNYLLHHGPTVNSPAKTKQKNCVYGFNCENTVKMKKRKPTVVALLYRKYFHSTINTIYIFLILFIKNSA